MFPEPEAAVFAKVSHIPSFHLQSISAPIFLCVSIVIEHAAPIPASQSLSYGPPAASRYARAGRITLNLWHRRPLWMQTSPSSYPHCATAAHRTHTDRPHPLSTTAYPAAGLQQRPYTALPCLPPVKEGGQTALPSIMFTAFSALAEALTMKRLSFRSTCSQFRMYAALFRMLWSVSIPQ